MFCGEKKLLMILKKKHLECVYDLMRCIVANIRINVKKTKINLEK